MNFFLTLADAIPSADITNMINKAVDSAHTDNAKIAIVVIGAVLFIWIVDLFTIKMPLNKARIKSDAKTAEAVESLAATASNTFKVSMDTNTTQTAIVGDVKKINDKVSTLIAIKRQELDAMELMSEKSGIDLSKQIDRAHGSLTMLTDLQK